MTAGGCGGGDAEVTNGGPLEGAGLGASSNTSGETQLAGREVMFGVAQVVNDGTSAVTLDRISIVDLDEDLELVDTWAAGPDRRKTWALEPRWPNRRDYPRLLPVRGYEVPPGGRDVQRSVQLLFVFRSEAVGRHRATEVAIDYHRGDRRYRRVLDTSAVICIVAADAPRKCPGGILDPETER